jgi:hypothetical protein
MINLTDTEAEQVRGLLRGFQSLMRSTERHAAGAGRDNVRRSTLDALRKIKSAIKALTPRPEPRGIHG